MKTLTVLLAAVLLFGCTKPELIKPMAATPPSANSVTTVPVPVKKITVGGPNTSLSKVDTVKFNVYAIKFDSVSTNAYNLCIIEVRNGKLKDSVTAPMGLNYGLACRNAAIDTTSNKTLIADEDSSVVTLHVQKTDTVEFFVVSTLCKLAPIHAADFKYTGTFAKVYEVPSILPGPQNGPMAGVHIYKNVNTVFIP